MKLILSVLVFCLGVGLSARADLPQNNLHLQDRTFKSKRMMTEEQFNQIIDHVKSKMGPYANAHYKWLVVQRMWNSSTVNASALQLGPVWLVTMFGGLARRPEITPDGFALVMCHEMGHHMAGFPYYPGLFGPRSASTEGESDYFASQVCTKELWRDDLEGNARVAKYVDGFAKAQCDNVYNEEAERNLCYRVAMAGFSMASLLSSMKADALKEGLDVAAGKELEIEIPLPAQFSTPDTAIVDRTFPGHPDPQCRLDTYLAGAICTAKFDLSVIPARDLWLGRNSARAEEIAAQYSCTSKTHQVGIRPACWFSKRF